jgi:hypothetical protein
MVRRDFLEISSHQADEGELIGKQPYRCAFANSLPEIQGAESSQGHSGEVSRLLLRKRGRGSQVRRG